MTDQSLSVFDRTNVRRHRDRAARSFAHYDFITREVADRLADRLDDVRRAFPCALDLGARDGTLARTLQGRGGIETLVESELSGAMAMAAAERDAAEGPVPGLQRPRVVADEEVLPFAEKSFDLVLSNLTLHWTNDLPGALLQINHALKPDGLFLAAMFGGATLYELRQCLMQAEEEVEGGAGPRVSPFAQNQDGAELLQRAGFALPVTDVDTLTVTYPDALKLMDDLRGMGESNAVRERRKSWTRRETLVHAAQLYEEQFGNGDGTIPATFEVVYLTAWRPEASQPLPLRPGQAHNSLAQALDTEEVETGIKARPR
ncbi:methyltransferase domain-containing protein [Rhodovibrio salinarum]|uniref:SAM-dependent methyltransferase n=1 Tax=Rhodovibrio salinarum TaxID=1087 RepID=A0A934UZF0_9PROT|nr:methyltransferase domain-containing protein [Rhodovibrio salinarum]MBK1697122.1 SAM-dependent methyltransferase [Rhodovibrio salinarum]